ncbi:MAG: LemA family protein [Bacteroidales bacterium]|nr:LemA family protein [Bacteroidales bacterium]MDY2973226.1 LemA family protein [Candidatus Cryptobacteroides sp.]MED9899597.1 LemA family protein [Bacteroidales bacterium]HAW06986.1 LemA family protein [Rikenellaceae bacterium]
MKKGKLLWIVAIVVALGLFGWCKNTYNGMVSADEGVQSAWSQVENVYQRRADLIPNLVATVKGYAEHESGTLEAVVAARAKATQTTVDPSQLTAENIAKFQAAQGELGSALGRLLVTVERYPDLKANQNFLELQAQLEGTENRISTERMKFNETAKSYNTLIRSFPQNILASIFSFTPKGYFKAAEGSENAPKVEF